LILQISPDSGTKETYLKIKGQNGYERVWQNIKKYCKYPKNVFVKYIIFSFNSDKEEIIQFVQKCIESGVKNIVISPEAKSFRNDDDWEYGNITEKEIKAAALLNKLAVKEHINVELSPIWRKENISLINELNKQKILL
jgi:pyruvate-formate lyase-activating enzyme